MTVRWHGRSSSFLSSGSEYGCCRAVCWCPVQSVQVFGFGPADLLMLCQVWVASDQVADECAQLDSAKSVGVTGCAYPFMDLDPAPQFFADFSFQSLTWSFTAFDLAAREFPISFQGSSWSSLCAQDSATTHDGSTHHSRAAMLVFSLFDHEDLRPFPVDEPDPGYNRSSS